MTRKTLLIASIIIVAALLTAGAFVGLSIPGDVRLPTHWGLNGEPDRFADKWTALLIPGALVGCLSILLYFLPALEPRRQGFQRSQGLYLWTWAALLIFGVAMQLAVVGVALGWTVHGTSFVFAGLGAMLVLIGNQLGKSRSMYLIGIRTPWTLASEEVWMKTHRLAGKLMVGGGLLLAGAAFLPLPSGVIATIMLVVVAGAVLVPAIYSFVLWRGEQRDDQASG